MIPVSLLFTKKITTPHQTAIIIKNIIIVNISSFKLSEANNGVYMPILSPPFENVTIGTKEIFEFIIFRIALQNMH